MHSFFILILGLILGLSGCTFESAPIDIEDNMTALNQKKGWSASGPIIAGAGSAGQGISLQANFEEEPGNYTVQFGIVTPDTLNLPNGVILKATAEITWSVEGNDVRRLVDCVNGMSVSGTAQGVKVVIRDNSTSTQAIEYQVSVQVVKGTRPSVSHPPFLTGDTEFLANLANVEVPIPVNAGVTSVAVYVAPVPKAVIAENDVMVQHHRIGGVVALNQYDPRDYQWVTIAAGANTVNLINNSGGFVLFTPVWGIDG